MDSHERFSSYSQSLELDKNGDPHIIYKSGTDIDYAVWSSSGSNWNIQTVDSESYLVGNLVLDSEGYSHFTYVPINNPAFANVTSFAYVHLMYASWNGTAGGHQP